MASLELAVLSQHDVPAAQALSTHVGWNQTEADWRRLLDLNPGQGVAARVNGDLVATATLASYGEVLHWIGMVIVHESQRGKGLGKEVFRSALEIGLENSGSTVGLDATDLGRPLYRKHGFEDICSIDRWSGRLQAQATEGRAIEASAKDLGRISAMDRHGTGVDRERLLRHLLDEEGVKAWFTAEGSEITGHAILRPGRRHWQLGPLLAQGSGEMAPLLDAAAHHLQGEPVLVDVLQPTSAPRTEETGELLSSAGLEVERRLMRMTYGGRTPALTGSMVRLAAGLELG